MVVLPPGGARVRGERVVAAWTVPAVAPQPGQGSAREYLMLTHLKKTVRLALNGARRSATKEEQELRFWAAEIVRYQRWYAGEFPLYGTACPAEPEKVFARNSRDASVLTWHKFHQEPKYLYDLDVVPDAFQGMRLLDVGAGPMPSATCFSGCRVYCLEPLLPEYLHAGFPLHYYENVVFIRARSENIPVESKFFDAVISVNAIDHVNDIHRTADEIRRVLKPGGRLRLHVHYHSRQTCEPIQLDTATMASLFSWCPGFVEKRRSNKSFSHLLPPGQLFALWSNF